MDQLTAAILRMPASKDIMTIGYLLNVSLQHFLYFCNLTEEFCSHSSFHHSFIWSFVYSFIYLLMKSLTYSLTHWLIDWLIHSFTCLFSNTYYFTCHCFICSWTEGWSDSFIHSSIPLFIHFAHGLTDWLNVHHSFIHLFIPSFTYKSSLCKPQF